MSNTTDAYQEVEETKVSKHIKWKSWTRGVPGVIVGALLGLLLGVGLGHWQVSTTTVS